MKIRPIVYIIPLIILAIALLMGSSLLLRVFTLLFVVGLVGVIWTVTGLRGLQLKNGDIPNHCQVGGHFKEELTVINESKLPKLLLKVEETTSLKGYHNTIVLNLPAGDSKTWQSTVECHQRGLHTLGSLTVVAGDPFGLLSSQRTLGTPNSIIVYPRVVELPYFRSSYSGQLDFGYETNSRRTSQISPSASSVREMVSGDSQEHIHWRSTAHTGKLMVKIFDAEHSSDDTKDVWIVLDMQQAAQAGQDKESTEEYGVTIAASLAKKYLDDGMKVGLFASGEQTYTLTPSADQSRFSQILESLALIRATGNEPVESLLSGTERFGSGSAIVVITPQSTEGVLNALRRLKNYGHPVLAVLLDNSSFGGTLSPMHMAQVLGATGSQAYIVRQGDNLTKALDSRKARWYTRYI
jgi:uncharacterized protein (DUF58 family)